MALNVEGVDTVDIPVLAHILKYIPRIGIIFTDLAINIVDLCGSILYTIA